MTWRLHWCGYDDVEVVAYLAAKAKDEILIYSITTSQQT
jgi:hypothetical protein